MSFRRSLWRRNRRCRQILNKDGFVLRLVVEQFVRNCSYHRDTKSPWADAKLIANQDMRKRLFRWLPHSCVGQSLEGEAGSWIRYAIQDHPRGSHVSDPYFPVWIQLPTPLHGVKQQLAERHADHFALVIGEIRIELDEK